MYEIIIYRNVRGKEPISEYLRTLNKKKDKDSRVKLNKIQDYIEILSKHGTNAGMPYIKHLEGLIWELRPINDRILFFAFKGNSFVLLHHFIKKTQKTPQHEIEQAKRNMASYLERDN